MKNTTTLFLLSCLFLPSLLCAQAQKFTISGYVEDAASGEKLIAANVFDLRSLQGAVSNTYGFFSLTLPADSVRLAASYIGYQDVEAAFLLRKDTTITFRLTSQIELPTVEIKASKQERIEENSQMSQVAVPVDQIEKLPALLGEVDVLKTLQLLPGVQGGGEGQNGVYVRGGSPDQNLILLDGVPVYNASHLLGFFSVFNSDAIKNVTLTKGGFPARYGGRLSSIIEINMKEGNMQELHGEGSIGLISSRLTLEAPIVKGKTSFMVSGRRTYADLIFGPLIKASAKKEDVDANIDLYFYDLNAKVNHKFNDKHRLFLSAYLGSDVFAAKIKENYPANSGYFLTDAGTDWGNITAAARWNFMISKKLFANTTLTYSRFRFDFQSKVEEKDAQDFISYSAKYLSGIFDWAGKVDFDFVPNPKHYVRFGGGVTHHTYDPGAFVFKAQFEDEKFDTTLGTQRTRATEFSLYAEDDVSLGALKMNLGVHASGFYVNGTFYQSVQPRIGLRYLLNNDWAIKASFATMAQYINLLTNESLSLPTDLWVPSTARIKPQTSWQPAIGVARTFWDEYEFSVEGYYKKMQNVLSYKEGVSFLGLENDWQDKVTQGVGESYGAEIFLQKKSGKTTGWLGYTLSKTTRQFDDINSGKRFPFKYDRRHDLELVVSHKFSEKITLSGTWVYGTGNAITLPLFRYDTPVEYDQDSGYFFERELESIGEKNSFRMKPYHRMDLSIEFHKKKRRYERTWVLAAYNVYNRANPYFIYDGVDPDTNQRAFRQVALFPIIPSFSYNFKF
ncbi:MAG: TonB-dependent receptor plug domain-containing protein [Bacteroidota bacterium]|mgnify:CR=1 FL=1